MKTYKFLLLLALCTVVVGTSYAQTNYYTTTRVFQGSGYSYQCDSDGGIVDLYNSTNQFENVAQTLNGALFDPDVFYDQNMTSNWGPQRRQAQGLAAGIFTTTELNMFKNNPRQFLSIGLVINPQTGKVWEVDYNFLETFDYAKVPVERYRAIELAFKNNLTFPITAAERQLNYCFTWFHFDPNAGPPSNFAITGPSSPRPGGELTFRAAVSPSVESVSWSIQPMTGVQSVTPNQLGSNSCTIRFSSAAANRSYSVIATAVNAYGQRVVSYSFQMGPYTGDYEVR